MKGGERDRREISGGNCETNPVKNSISRVWDDLGPSPCENSIRATESGTDYEALKNRNVI